VGACWVMMKVYNEDWAPQILARKLARIIAAARVCARNILLQRDTGKVMGSGCST